VVLPCHVAGYWHRSIEKRRLLASDIDLLSSGDVSAVDLASLTIYFKTGAFSTWLTRS
jgi:hypothetical protein